MRNKGDGPQDWAAFLGLCAIIATVFWALNSPSVMLFVLK